ncbi:MAG: putative hydro-lyase [Bacillota bacterium]
MDLSGADSRSVRKALREGTHRGPTAGLARGHAQANMVIIHRDLLESFMVFCVRNPIPCPLIDVTDPGDPEPRASARGADLRRDLGRYNVYRDGKLDEVVSDLDALWDEEMVGLLLGCSYTFERALMDAGVPLRHIEAGRVVPMYITDIPTREAGPFRGPVVVSMRPVPARLVSRATALSARYAFAHGAPVHVGDPEVIGIENLGDPDYGDRPAMREGDVPMFWACGVTSQRALLAAAPPLAMAHVPGHMFVTDLLDEDLAGGIPVWDDGAE